MEGRRDGDIVGLTEKVSRILGATDGSKLGKSEGYREGISVGTTATSRQAELAMTFEGLSS